jgi:protein TonB
LAAVLQSRFTPLRPSTAPRRAGALVTIALHLLAVLALLSYEPSRSALFAVAPIMIDLIVPPKPEIKTEQPTAPPKPKPVAKVTPSPIAPQPIMTAPTEAPSPVAAAPQPPAPPAPAPIDATPATPIPAKAEPPVTQPIFNADYLENPAPVYPALSRRMNEQGRVVLRVYVGVGGRAEDVQLRSASGSARLDDAARDAVRRWKFVPAKRGSEPVAAWVLIPISFKLEG